MSARASSCPYRINFSEFTTYFLKEITFQEQVFCGEHISICCCGRMAALFTFCSRQWNRFRWRAMDPCRADLCRRYVNMCLHSDLSWTPKLRRLLIFPMRLINICISHGQHQGSWWLGYTRSQNMSNQNVYIVYQENPIHTQENWHVSVNLPLPWTSGLPVAIQWRSSVPGT